MASSRKKYQYDVFILYLEDDYTCRDFAVKELLEPLESEPYSLRCAIEFRDMGAGGLWLEQVVAQAASDSICTVIPFCSSSECLRVKNSLRAAVLANCDAQKVLFIKCDNCQIPVELKSYSTIDASNQHTRQYMIQRIQKTVKGTQTPEEPYMPDSTTEIDVDAELVHAEDSEVFVGLNFIQDSNPACGVKLHKVFKIEDPTPLEGCMEQLSYQITSSSESGKIQHATQSVLQIHLPNAVKSEDYLLLLKFADCSSKEVKMKAYQAIYSLLYHYLSKSDIVHCMDERFYSHVLYIEHGIANLLRKETLDTEHSHCEKLWEAYSIIVGIICICFAVKTNAKKWIVDRLGRIHYINSAEAFTRRFSWILELPCLAKYSVSTRSLLLFCQQGLQLLRDNKGFTDDIKALFTQVPVDVRSIKKFTKIPVTFQCIFKMLISSKIIHDKDFDTATKEAMYIALYNLAKNMTKCYSSLTVKKEEKEMLGLCVAKCIINILDNHKYKLARDHDIIQLLFERTYKKASDAVKDVIIEKTQHFRFHANSEIQEKVITFFCNLNVGQSPMNEAKDFIQKKYSTAVEFRWNPYCQPALQKRTKEINYRGKMGERNIVTKVLHLDHSDILQPELYLKIVQNSHQYRNGNICHLHVNELEILTQLTPSRHIIELLGYQVRPMPLFYIVEDIQAEYDSLKHYILDQRLKYNYLDYECLQKISLQVVEAVNFCHKNNIVVRNITPTSFLIKPNNVVKLSNFTIAREMKTGMFDQLVFEDKDDVDARTYLPVLYASPESLLHGIYTTAHDTWSVICTAYELFTMGCPPFHRLIIEKRRPIVEILQLVIYGLKPINEVINVPSDVLKVMLSCLELEYSERGTLEHFVAALRPSGKRRLSGFRVDIDLSKLPSSYIYQPEIEGSLGIPYGLKTEEQALCSEPPYVNARTEDMRVNGYFPCQLVEVYPCNPPKLTTGNKQAGQEFRIMCEETDIDIFCKGELDELLQLQHHNLVQMFDTIPNPKLGTLKLYYKLESYEELSFYDIARNKTEDKQYCLDRLAEIACGCSYLHEKGWILRDIRPEFIQIVNGHSVIARISRMVKLKLCCYDRSSTYSNCKVKLDVPLDLRRRIPLESLQDGIFSQGSDVFTFGILVYEVYFLLSTKIKDQAMEELVPYCSIKLDEIPNFLEERKTLEQPCLMPDSIYHICKKTWYQERINRPSMADITENLNSPKLISYKRRRVSLNGRSMPAVPSMFHHRGSIKHQNEVRTRIGQNIKAKIPESEDSQSEYHSVQSSIKSSISSQNTQMPALAGQGSHSNDNYQMPALAGQGSHSNDNHQSFPKRSLGSSSNNSSIRVADVSPSGSNDGSVGVFSQHSPSGSSSYDLNLCSNYNLRKGVHRISIHDNEAEYANFDAGNSIVESQYVHSIDDTTSLDSWGTDFNDNPEIEKHNVTSHLRKFFKNRKRKDEKKKKNVSNAGKQKAEKKRIFSRTLSEEEYQNSDYCEGVRRSLSEPNYSHVDKGLNPQGGGNISDSHIYDTTLPPRFSMYNNLKSTVSLSEMEQEEALSPESRYNSHTLAKQLNSHKLESTGSYRHGNFTYGSVNWCQSIRDKDDTYTEHVHSVEHYQNPCNVVYDSESSKHVAKGLNSQDGSSIFDNHIYDTTLPSACSTYNNCESTLSLLELKQQEASSPESVVNSCAVTEQLCTGKSESTKSNGSQISLAYQSDQWCQRARERDDTYGDQGCSADESHQNPYNIGCYSEGYKQVDKRVNSQDGNKISDSHIYDTTLPLKFSMNKSDSNISLQKLKQVELSSSESVDNNRSSTEQWYSDKYRCKGSNMHEISVIYSPDEGCRSLRDRDDKYVEQVHPVDESHHNLCNMGYYSDKGLNSQGGSNIADSHKYDAAVPQVYSVYKSENNNSLSELKQAPNCHTLAEQLCSDEYKCKGSYRHGNSLAYGPDNLCQSLTDRYGNTYMEQVCSVDEPAQDTCDMGYYSKGYHGNSHQFLADDYYGDQQMFRSADDRRSAHMSANDALPYSESFEYTQNLPKHDYPKTEANAHQSCSSNYEIYQSRTSLESIYENLAIKFEEDI